MVNVRFDVRDIFKAPRIALSFQRLWIQFIGIVTGYVVYVMFTYLSFWADGQNIANLWERHGLVPLTSGINMTWIAWIIYGAGCILLAAIWFLTAAAVARAVYMVLKGNTFYTWKEAIRFAFVKKWGSVISTPITIAVIIAVTAFGGILIGFMGRIPVVGEIGISVFMLIWYFASLFIVFVVLAFFASLLIAPSAIAATDDDAFEGIFQSFSILGAQPTRFICYTLLNGILAAAGWAVIAIFAKQAWQIMNTILIAGMGTVYGDITYRASYIVQSWFYPALTYMQSALGGDLYHIFIGQDFLKTDITVIQEISAFITAVFLVITGGFVISYPIAVFNSGQCILFIMLKKTKDDDNLLERKDAEEEDDDELLISENKEPEDNS